MNDSTLRTYNALDQRGGALFFGENKLVIFIFGENKLFGFIFGENFNYHLPKNVFIPLKKNHTFGGHFECIKVMNPTYLKKSMLPLKTLSTFIFACQICIFPAANGLKVNPDINMYMKSVICLKLFKFAFLK